ncbi:unnamed protein product [Ophioblennius macclurei]
MRTRARCSGRGGGALSLRSGVLLLLVPPLLLALQQLLVAGSRLPGAASLRTLAGREAAEEEEEVRRDGRISFTVISIEPAEKTFRWGTRSRRPGELRHRQRQQQQKEEEEEEEALEEDGEQREGTRFYEENELHLRQVGPRTLKLQPWAADKPSFTAELNRIVAHITRPQLNCSRVLSPGQAQEVQHPAAAAHWLLCAEDWLIPAGDGACVAYSFSMDGGDADFLRTVSRLGCEVHSFGLGNSDASGGHLGNSLASNRGDGGVVSQHKMWLEWRARKRRKHKARGNLGGVSQTLADIMAALGHRTVHFLYADLLSAEWRVFQSWIELGTLENVHHLVATVHLQWAGFEVGGTNEEVLRYWFSVLQGLQASGLKLVHSSAGGGHAVLKQTVADASSSYTLSWVNTQH